MLQYMTLAAFNRTFILQLLKVFSRWLVYAFRSRGMIQFQQRIIKRLQNCCVLLNAAIDLGCVPFHAWRACCIYSCYSPNVKQLMFGDKKKTIHRNQVWETHVDSCGRVDRCQYGAARYALMRATCIRTYLSTVGETVAVDAVVAVR